MQSRCKLTSGSSGNNATMVIKDGSWKAIGGPATMNPRSASEGRADNRSHPYPQHAFGSNELGIHGTGGYHAQGMGAAAADSLTKLVGAFAAATPIIRTWSIRISLRKRVVLQAIKSTSPQVLQAIKLMCLQHMHLTPGMVPRHGKDQHQTHQRVLPWRHQDHTQQQFGVSGLRNNNLEGKVEKVESHECLQRMFDKTTVAKRAEPFHAV